MDEKVFNLIHFQEGLTSFDNFDDSLIDSAYSAYFPMGVPDAMSYGKLKYLDDYMTESTSTCATAKTLDDSRVSVSCRFISFALCFIWSSVFVITHLQLES